jgi:Zn finger protein HypA/HybF involved in hydrogenase expression
VSIASFLVFTSLNWRCPACNKNLGADIHRRVCKKCGSRLR